MIRTQELVPDYYIEKSRDFQVLCRLYDFAFNALKYNVDSMRTVTDTRMAKDTVLPLIGDKFGVYDKLAYSNRFLLEALPIALKYKGSLKAVSILINAYLDSEEIFDYAAAFHCKDKKSSQEMSELLNREVKPYSITILLSDYPSMTNLHILSEYLKMVIPSGMIVEYMFGVNYRIIEKFKYIEHVFLLFTNTISMDNETVKAVSLVKSSIDKYAGDTEGITDEFTKKVLGDVDINSVSIATVSSAPQEEIE